MWYYQPNRQYCTHCISDNLLTIRLIFLSVILFMTITIMLFTSAIALVGGCFLGYYIRHIVALSKKGSIELEIVEKLVQAKEESQRIKDDAKKESDHIIQKAEKEWESVKKFEQEAHESVKRNEERLASKESLLDNRQTELDNEVRYVKEKAEEIKQIKEGVIQKEHAVVRELERVARSSEYEAKEELVKRIEKKHQEDLLVRMNKLDHDSEIILQKRAFDILTTAIHRLGNSVVNEYMTTSVPLPSEDVKGKIIGKEGRNIRVFERVAGVDLLVDDTPGAIVISAFDPVRRHIAKNALEKLIEDGRIQPAKIEEFITKAGADIANTIKKKGEDAIFECGLLSVDPKLVQLLGRLHFRTSYGQNVLQHSIEMAHIAGMIASELGGNVIVAKAGALFHDIGKAVDHEIEGTHVEIGRKILLKYGVDEKIVQAMQSHHEEYPYETIESVIVQVADAISGGRPGARRDTVENYLKRLADLEAIANSFAGIEKSYALQAGREIRIFVTPEQVSEIMARDIARNIALRVEQELRYPGEIKVNVIRETRVIEIAR